MSRHNALVVAFQQCLMVIAVSLVYSQKYSTRVIIANCSRKRNKCILKFSFSTRILFYILYHVDGLLAQR